MRHLLASSYALAFILAGLSVCSAEAQIRDRRAVSVGIGLGVYQGELDKNSANNPVEFFASGNVGLTALMDGYYGPIVWEAGLNYQRIDININEAEFDVNVVGAEFTVGKDFRLLARDRFLRAFVGIAPAYIGTTYIRTTTPDGQQGVDQRPFGRILEEKPTRFSLYVPVGVVLQDAVRVSVRLFLTDYLDSVERPDSGPDWSPSITLLYRFGV